MHPLSSDNTDVHPELVQEVIDGVGCWMIPFSKGAFVIVPLSSDDGLNVFFRPSNTRGLPIRRTGSRRRNVAQKGERRRKTSSEARNAGESLLLILFASSRCFSVGSYSPLSYSLVPSVKLRRIEELSAQFSLPGGILSAELRSLSHQKLRR
jgi:hypothetical protein